MKKNLLKYHSGDWVWIVAGAGMLYWILAQSGKLGAYYGKTGFRPAPRFTPPVYAEGFRPAPRPRSLGMGGLCSGGNC